MSVCANKLRSRIAYALSDWLIYIGPRAVFGLASLPTCGVADSYNSNGLDRRKSDLRQRRVMLASNPSTTLHKPRTE